MFLVENDVRKIYQALPDGDPEKSLGSMKLMQSLLNMEEFTELKNGLSTVLAWMKNSNG